MAAKRVVLGNQDASSSSLAENCLRQSIAHIHLQTSQQANAFSLPVKLFYWLNLPQNNMGFREMLQQETKKRAVHRDIFQTPICTGMKQDVLAGRSRRKVLFTKKASRGCRVARKWVMTMCTSLKSILVLPQVIAVQTLGYPVLLDSTED